MNAERAVIGSCLAYSQAADEAVSALSPEDFASPNLSAIFAAIGSLATSGSAIRADSVALELGVSFDSKMGMELLDLSGEATVGFSRAIRRVSEDAMRRRFIAGSVELRAAAADGRDIDELLKTAAEIADIHPHTAQARTIAQIAEDHLPAMTDAREYYTLNPWGLRIRSGTSTVVGARPGVGKSAFGLQAVQDLAERHVRSRIYSYEMSDEEWVERCIARNCGLTPEQIDDGIGAEGVDYVRKTMAGDWLGFASIVDAVGWPLHRVVSDMIRFGRQGGKVAVIDYLQLMVTQDYDHVTEASRQIKIAARASGLAVVCLSQLSRKSVDGKPRAPQLSDLRQSGALEQDADNVVLLHHYEDDDEAVRMKLKSRGYLADEYTGMKLGHVHLAKRRRGKKDIVIPAWFDGADMRWDTVNQTMDGRRL